eukprot:4464166-Lingulodinium_polyedra.AAC.1
MARVNRTKQTRGHHLRTAGTTNQNGFEDRAHASACYVAAKNLTDLFARLGAAGAARHTRPCLAR